MFRKLKDKLKNWTKKLSEKTEKTEEVQKEIKKEKENAKQISQKVQETIKNNSKKSFINKLDKSSDSEQITKEIALPTKFEVGHQKVEPDLKKIKEIEENLTHPKSLEEKENPQEKDKKSFLNKISSKVSKVKITEKEFDVYAEELNMLLLENNVAFEVAEKIVEKLREKIVGRELLKKEVEGEIKDCFKEIIEEILVKPFDVPKKVKEKSTDQSKEPYVILFCGINGTGKTTTIAKIAQQLKEQNLSCVIAAADTFRAASIEQIKMHGEKLDVKVISQQYGADPAAVAFDAIKYAKKNLINCVLIDTAGRIHTAKNLLKEIEKIAKVANPDLKIYVGESLTGNDLISQSKSFDWAIGIDAIILTKSDVDDKGGAMISIGYITKKPILYLGVGQDYDDIEPFDKKKVIRRLGLGD